MMKFIHKNYILEKLRAEESELRYRTLIESTTEAIFIAQGEYLQFVNPVKSKDVACNVSTIFQGIPKFIV